MDKRVTDKHVDDALIKWCGGRREVHNPAMRANMRRVLEQFAAFAPAQGEPVRDALENLLIAIGMGWDLEGVVQQARDALTAPARNVTERELPSKEWVGPVAAFELGAESMYDTLAKDPAPAPTEGGWVLVPRDPTDEMVRQGSVARAGMGDKSGDENTTLTYRAMIAAAPAQGDWVIVPREPTEAMVVAGCRHENMGDMAGRYKAMLASAPVAPISDDVKAERAIHCWFMEAPDGSNSAGPFDTEVQGLSWAKMSAVHAPHYAEWEPVPLYRAMLAAAPIRDDVKAEREACAKVIEDNQETIRETANGTERGVSPRTHGNLAGLAYAAAIRARSEP
jgi:hypothetical protein